MPRGKPIKNPNGYGSVVKLSGKRRKPFEVRVNTRMDKRYYPVYDVLGRFPTREEALIALAGYNKNPYSITDREMTFSQLYEKFYKTNTSTAAKPIPAVLWTVPGPPTGIAALYTNSPTANCGPMISGVSLPRQTVKGNLFPTLCRNTLRTSLPRWINMPCRMMS